MENLAQAVNISILALTVIFIVLTILIFTIKFLVHFLPYEEPPAATADRRLVSGESTDGAHVAAITAALASHLRKSPQEFHILNIKSG